MQVEGSDGRDDDAYEDFYENTCKDCEYYFDDYIEEDSNACERVQDRNGNFAVSITYRSCCPCYDQGIEYVTFPCEAGHDDPGDNDSHASEAEGSLPPMAYAMEVCAKDGMAYKSYAWMQACDPVQQLVSRKFRTLNTFAPDHSICWGTGNSDPDTLVEVVDTYCDSTANADLLKPREYVNNCEAVRTRALPDEEIYDAIKPGFDAVLLVTLNQQRSAYLLLRGSGFIATNGLIAVGLKRHTLDQDGTSLEGFLTPADSNDRCWFLLPHPDRFTNSSLESQVLLLGQIPSPHADSCSSPAPSSSEPAALAAS